MLGYTVFQERGHDDCQVGKTMVSWKGKHTL